MRRGGENQRNESVLVIVQKKTCSKCLAKTILYLLKRGKSTEGRTGRGKRQKKKAKEAKILVSEAKGKKRKKGRKRKSSKPAKKKKRVIPSSGGKKTQGRDEHTIRKKF